MIDDILNNKFRDFIARFENAESYIKQQVHFNSTKNICKEILVIKNKKATKRYKESIISYFDKIENITFPIEKMLSEKLYHEYIFESGRYLMYKSNFKTNGSLMIVILLGVLIDSVIWFFDVFKADFFIPIFTITLMFYGFKIKNKAIKEGKYFVKNW